jgi:hypothetical protein
LDCGRSTTFTVSLEGITETEAAGILNFCTTIGFARTRQANHNSYKVIVLRVCREQPTQELTILNAAGLAAKVTRNDTSSVSARHRAMPDMRFGFIDLHAGPSHVSGSVRPMTVDQHFGRECARGINWQRRPS